MAAATVLRSSAGLAVRSSFAVVVDWPPNNFGVVVVA